MTIKPADYPHVLQRYCELGGDNDQALQMLRSQLSRHESELRDYGRLMQSADWTDEEKQDIFRNIKASRDKRTACLTAIQRHAQTPMSLGDQDHVRTRRREFERICAFRQIIWAMVDSDNAINLITRATHTYEGILYDLGDWVIKFGGPNPVREVEVLSFRRGLRTTWPSGIYPDYEMTNGDFCLGGNRAAISSHFDAERFLAGIQLIIGVVCSVNRDDIEKIPYAFYPYQPTETGGSKCLLFTHGPTTST